MGDVDTSRHSEKPIRQFPSGVEKGKGFEVSVTVRPGLVLLFLVSVAKGELVIHHIA